MALLYFGTRKVGVVVTQAARIICRLLLVLVLCSTCFPTPTDCSANTCTAIYAGQCYFINNEKLTWTDARDKCKQQNTYLVNIGSEAENTFLLRILLQDRDMVWTGFNDKKREGDWRWQNSGSVGTYKNWAYGQPDNYKNEDCCTLVKRNVKYRHFQGKWNDQDCDHPTFYICERASTCDAMYMGHCYVTDNQRLKWNKAKERCKQLNGYLVNIGSEPENRFLLQTFFRGYDVAWTGYNDITREDIWLWENSGSPGRFTKWAQSQPDNFRGIEDCGTLIKRSINPAFREKWNDDSCNQAFWYICERASTCEAMYMGHCYFTGNQSLNWNKAKERCKQLNGYLVNIGSESENRFLLQNFFRGYDVARIGYNDINREGTWLWENSRSAGRFTNWADHQPDNYNGIEDCGTLIKRSNTLAFREKWNDDSCNYAFVYICERDFDECSSGEHSCSADAICTNIDGSFSCTCKEKYTGNGMMCTKLKCKRLVTSRNTWKSTEQSTVDTVVHLGCNTGYERHGASSSKCLTNQQWTERVPTCQDFDECSSGNHTCSSNAKCINSDGSYSCSCKRKFTGDGRTCKEITCPDIVHPKNGWKSSDVKTVDTVLDFNCHTGYIINGLRPLQCLVSGKWNGTAPTQCQDIDECSLGIHNCSINATCRDSEGSYSCTCNEKFTGDGRVCTRLKCPNIMSPKDGLKSTEETFVDTIVNFSCHTGYKLHGLSVKCLENQQWNGTIPNCEAVQCEDLSSLISNSIINSTNVSFPSTVPVICNHGYWLPHTHTQLFCNSSGLWSPTPLQCNPIMCPELDNTTERTTDVSGYTVGSIANYSCKEGYTTREVSQDRIVDTSVVVQTCTTPDTEINGTEIPIGEWLPELPESFCLHQNLDSSSQNSPMVIIVLSTVIIGFGFAVFCTGLLKWIKKVGNDRSGTVTSFTMLHLLRQSTADTSNPSTDPNHPRGPQDDTQYSTLGGVDSLYAVTGPAAFTSNPKSQFSFARPALMQSTTQAEDDNMYAHLSHQAADSLPQEQMTTCAAGQNFASATDDYAHLDRSTTQKILASRNNK